MAKKKEKHFTFNGYNKSVEAIFKEYLNLQENADITIKTQQGKIQIHLKA